MIRAVVVALALVLLAACGRSSPTAKPQSTAVQKPRVIYGRTVRVRFDGNRAIPTRDLLAVMSIDKSTSEDGSPDEAHARDILERDVLLINATYYDHGYMQVEVGEPIVTESEEGPFVDVVIPIKKEGPRIKIRSLTIFERNDDGKEVEPLGGKAALRKRISVPDGGWFARDVLVKDLNEIRKLYRDAGYASVEAEPETVIDEKHASVDVIIPIKRGPIVRIERIDVVGNAKVPTERILREVEPRVGEQFNETKLEASKARLVALKVFRSLDVSTKEGADPEHLIVEIEVVEK